MKAINIATLRKIKRMKSRVIAVTIVMGMAMGMFVSGLYGGDVMDDSISSFFKETNMPDVFVEFSNDVNYTEISGILSSSEYVKTWELRLKLTGTYDYQGNNIPVTVIGRERVTNENISRLILKEGDFAPGKAVAVSGMENKGISHGKNLNVNIAGKSVSFNISGTVTSSEFVLPSSMFDYGLPLPGTLLVLYTDLATLQNVTGRSVNELLIIMSDESQRGYVVSSVESYGIKSVVFKENHPSELFMAAGAAKLRAMMPLIGVIFTLVGFVSIYMTMVNLIQADSRHIGVMMAMGYRRRDIIMSYIASGLVLGIIGIVFGIIMGLLFTAGIVQAGLSMYFNVSISYPFIPLPFIQGSLYTLAAIVVSVSIPVYMITGTSVREAIGYVPKTSIYALPFMKGKLSVISVMGIRNFIRNPRRIITTLMVVALTIGMAGSWLVMLDSSKSLIERRGNSDMWDVDVGLQAPINENNISAEYIGLNNSDVNTIVPYLKMKVITTSTQNNAGEGATLIVGDSFDKVKKFYLKEGKIDFSGAVITELLAKNLHVHTGENITIFVGNLSMKLKVTAIIYDIFVEDIYTEKKNLGALFPEVNFTGLYVIMNNTGASQDMNAYVLDMRTSSNVSSIMLHDDVKSAFNSIIGTASGFLGAFFIINAIITIIVTGAAVIISYQERDLEFAILDSIGISRRDVTKSIIVEMSMLGIFSGIIGIPLAFVVGKIMAVVLADVLFNFPVIFTIGAALLSFVMGIVFVIFSSFIPVKYSRNVDTEKVIRERTSG